MHLHVHVVRDLVINDTETSFHYVVYSPASDVNKPFATLSRCNTDFVHGVFPLHFTQEIKPNPVITIRVKILVYSWPVIEAISVDDMGGRVKFRPNQQPIQNTSPVGSKLSLFLLYGQRFPTYGLIFKIAIFGDETWQLAKVHINSLSTPRVKIELIFALRAAVAKIRADFQNCHIWTWNLAISQSCTYTLFLLQGVEFELIFALWAAVSDIWTDFKVAIFGHEISQSARSCTHTLFLPHGVASGLIFALRAVVSEIRAYF